MMINKTSIIAFIAFIAFILAACDPEVDDMSTTNVSTTSAEEVDDPDPRSECSPPRWSSGTWYTGCDRQAEIDDCDYHIWRCESEGSQQATHCALAHECYPRYHSLICLCAASRCSQGRADGCSSCIEACADVDSSWDPEVGPLESQGLTYGSYRALCEMASGAAD